MDRYIVLENGSVFKGKAFGADKEVIAEVVFTTGMTAYLETLTDPSYYGQAIVQTFPLIGDYGIIPSDAESCTNGGWAYIVREWCAEPSNFRCEGNIDDYLKKQGIPGVWGVDTRALTRIIRENGVMNGAITSDPSKVDMAALRAYRVTGGVKAMSVKEPEHVASEGGCGKQVVLMDFGMKANILRSLKKRGCDITIVPCDTSAEDIIAMKPDGIMLSNGAGDPEENTEIIANIRKLCATGIPIFGICLGHQLLALAHGFKTQKLKYGHRGANQPVKNLETGRIYISSQNHGYAVLSDSIRPEMARQTFINVNDGTNEGISYRNEPVFSVQFHPEACGGPLDTGFLFDKFVELMEGV